MNKKTYSQVLDDVANDKLPTALDLVPQIMARVQKGKGSTMQPRIKVVATMIVILLVMATLLVNVPAVRAAIQRWFGYIPGFGLVNEGQIRTLAEPVAVTQEGFTLKVEKVVLNGEKVVVSYVLEGLTVGMTVDKPGCLGTPDEPVMLLPGERRLKLSGMTLTFGSGNSYSAEITYTGMPADVNEATLVIDCFSHIAAGAVPPHWEVPLRFVPASPGMMVAPVLEAPPTVRPAAVTVESPATKPVVSQDGLLLKSVIPVPGGVILSGTIRVLPPQGSTVDEYDAYLEDVTITDASGQELSFDMAPNDFMTADLFTQPQDTYGWACQVYGENIQWPLTMTVHSLAARGPDLPQAEFQFDTGSDPQPDQVWMLDRDLALGAKTVHVVSVQRVTNHHGLNGYLFTFVDEPALEYSLNIPAHQDQAMGGGGSPAQDGMVVRGLGYREPVPTGNLTVLVTGHELLRLPGPWQVTWQAPTDGTPTP